jgi:hypothetical protein
MQTNNYGSIVGNFGSASIRQNGVNSRRLHRFRAYSEGHGLSDSISSHGSPDARNNTHSVELLPQEPTNSFSKCMFSQVETFI